MKILSPKNWNFSPQSSETMDTDKMAQANFGPKLFSYLPQHFSNLINSTHNYLPMKMEQRECSEASAYKIQTSGNYPEENI
jgi:hypothetical protein